MANAKHAVTANAATEVATVTAVRAQGSEEASSEEEGVVERVVDSVIETALETSIGAGHLVEAAFESSLHMASQVASLGARSVGGVLVSVAGALGGAPHEDHIEPPVERKSKAAAVKKKRAARRV